MVWHIAIGGSGTGTVPLAGNSITAPAVSLPIDYNTSPGEISGSLPTGGDCGGTYTYTWEASTDGGYSWGTVGGNTQSYTPGQLTQDISYRRTVSCGSASSTSNVVAITVNPEVMACTGNVSNFPYTENFEVSSSDWVNDDDNDVDWIRNSGGTPQRLYRSFKCIYERLLLLYAKYDYIQNCLFKWTLF